MKKAVLAGVLALGLVGSMPVSGEIKKESKQGLTTLEQAVHTQTPYVLSESNVERLTGFYSVLRGLGVSVEDNNPLTITEGDVKILYEKTQDSLFGLAKAFRSGLYCSENCNREAPWREMALFSSQAFQFMDKKDVGKYTQRTRAFYKITPAAKNNCSVMLSKEDVEVGINADHSGNPSQVFWDYVQKVKDFGFKEEYRSKGCGK